MMGPVPSDAQEIEASRSDPQPAAPIEGRALHVAITTPEGMLIWGGCCNVTPEFEDSFRDGACSSPTDTPPLP
jgi:hypothetical protein